MIAFVLMPKRNEPEQPVCAVVGCDKLGKAHQCPYDNAFHRHGRIHYESDGRYGSPGWLEFRVGWHLICDEHYAICVEARRAWERRMQLERLRDGEGGEDETE